MPGTWHPNQCDQTAVAWDWNVVSVVVVILTVRYCVCICVISIRNDCGLEFYCFVTLDRDQTLCLETIPGNSKGKGCLSLAVKQRAGRREDDGPYPLTASDDSGSVQNARLWALAKPASSGRQRLRNCSS